jgi:hypothetical protein
MALCSTEIERCGALLWLAQGGGSETLEKRTWKSVVFIVTRRRIDMVQVYVYRLLIEWAALLDPSRQVPE